MNNAFSSNADFLPQFKAIGQSLKRRFFRKPNVSDAVEQYESLCQELQREEQREFAAICCLEAARCQENLQNPISQANFLVKASKLYLQAKNSYKYFEENDDDDFKTERGHASHGYFQMAIQCMDQAAKIYKTQKNFGMCLILTMQMANVLYHERNYGEALKHYKNAYDMAVANFSLADQLVVMDQVLKCKVKLTEFESVSKIVSDWLITLNTRKSEIPRDFCQTLIQRFEIIRVCLILLLDVNTVDLVKFIWPEGLSTSNNGATDDRKEISLHLKSLVIAVQHGSVEEIQAVENNLSHVLNETQQDLFAALKQMQV